VGLDVPATGAVVTGAVVEAQPVLAPAGLGEGEEDRDVGRLLVGDAGTTRPTRTVTSPSVSTRSRSALGMTCRSFVMAATAASPSIGSADRDRSRRPTETATASSSSSSSGGSRPPAPRA
jgi:hypothetical protein